MNSVKQKLSGVFVPVVTPFLNDELLPDDLRFNINKLNKTGVTGYLALGSNGEFRSLSDKEQVRVLEIFAENKADKVIMAGTACESTKQTIEKTKEAASMGFDFASILTPNYFAKKMNDEILTGYYQKIADSSPIPVLLYNAPGFAGGVQISPKAVAQLSKHPNIRGMKDSSPTGPNRFLAQIDPSDEFYILAGSADFFYPALHLGAVGGILSLANAMPESSWDLYNLFLKKDYEKALDMHFRLMRLNSGVSGTFGVAGVKGAMDICGYRGREPRHPLKPITEAGRAEIMQKIKAEGFSIIDL